MLFRSAPTTILVILPTAIQEDPLLFVINCFEEGYFILRYQFQRKSDQYTGVPSRVEGYSQGRSVVNPSPLKEIIVCVIKTLTKPTAGESRGKHRR